MRLGIALLLMTIGSSGMYAVVVALPPIQAEFVSQARRTPAAGHLQVFGANLIGVGYQQREMDDVLQFADIARPGIAFQRVQGRGGQARRFAVHPLAVQAQEMLGEREDVVGAVPQRRQPHLGNIQPIQQIPAKPSGRHCLIQVDVGSRNQANIDGNGPACADPDYFPLLQNPQQFDLHGERQIADLVQEQRAAVCCLKPAFSAPGGAGERPGFMAKEFAFGQLFADCTAIDGKKGTFAPA